MRIKGGDTWPPRFACQRWPCKEMGSCMCLPQGLQQCQAVRAWQCWDPREMSDADPTMINIQEMIFYRRAGPLCFLSGAASAVTDAATFQISFNAFAFNVAAAAIEVTILPGSMHWTAMVMNCRMIGRGMRVNGIKETNMGSVGQVMQVGEKWVW